MPKKILFLVPYPLHEAPSQRFRFEQYFDLLQRRGYQYKVQSFLSSRNWRTFFEPGRKITKLVALVSGFAKRIIALFKSPMYDFVFIHREVTPVGPPIFEWIIAKILNRKIIYDFDDAIWHTDRENESLILRLAKWRSKVASICKWSYKVSCGNEYLYSYAAVLNRNVVYNPTTVDTENLHNPSLYHMPKQPPDKLRIGWTGSHSTLKYLHDIEAVLQKILNDYPQTEFVVIADRAPELNAIPFVKYIPWRGETEILDLLQLDIGLMPLPDDRWSKGKCGFKALQYMALEFPAVVSPVGVNTKIITSGINGFLCQGPEEWEEALKRLIESHDLRRQIGVMGRKTVLENYSVRANSANFLSLFE